VEAADYARKSRALPVQIDPVAIDRFTRLMREQLVSGDVAARKAYLASIVDAVIVSENKIRIMGSNDNIRSTFGSKGQPTPVVRKSVQEWCPALGQGQSSLRSRGITYQSNGYCDPFPLLPPLGGGLRTDLLKLPRLGCLRAFCW
jgi:hypothetical protein